MNHLLLDKNKKILQLEHTCKAQGIPVTIQRRLIFEALLERFDHPTVDQIYEDIQNKISGVSRTTVYRVLETLVQLGLATKASHPGATARFDANTTTHHHLVCLKCEKMVDLDPDQVDFTKVSVPTSTINNFLVTDYSIHFRGYCPECNLTK